MNTNQTDPRREASLGRPPLMDIEAVAERLCVRVRHVRRLVTERRIPYRKWGHLLRFDPTEIEEWLDSARVPMERDIGHPGTNPRSRGPTRRGDGTTTPVRQGDEYAKGTKLGTSPPDRARAGK